MRLEAGVTQSPYYVRRRRQARVRRIRRASAAGVVLLCALAVVFAFVYAGLLVSNMTVIAVAVPVALVRGTGLP